MQTVIETKTGWMIRCRKCGWHEFPKVGKPKATWHFNGNLEKPTFTPSLDETVNALGPYHNPDVPTRRCHLIVTDGRVEYCSGCTHDLEGQTLDLEPWGEKEVGYHAFLLQEPTSPPG